MAGSLVDTGATYPALVGLMYVFNLIVGTGALTMPLAFKEAGWAVGMVLIIFLSFMSFLSTTYVVEAMAAANAMLKYKKNDSRRSDSVSSEEYDNMVSDNDLSHPGEHQSLIYPHASTAQSYMSECSRRDTDYFEITERTEMGDMAKMFFSKIGMYLFYLVMIVYLYGDLAIYAVAVPKSLRDMTCTNISGTRDDENCWGNVSRGSVYRIYLAIFILLLGPFTFFNIQKTKYMQIFTSITRWVAFLMMIAVACVLLGEGKGVGEPVVAKISGIPNLFGVCIYSFMCHHSLPSILTPVRRKNHLTALLFGDIFMVLLFYALLSFTAIFTFADLNSLYTLNFSSLPGFGNFGLFVSYFLGLFPVFTISTNFPIICVTLRNNLKSLILREGRAYPFVVDRLLFPIMAVVPPVIVAFITTDIQMLVGITGSYAGAAVQYVIPATLAYFGRKKVAEMFGSANADVNKHRSLFKHNIWVVGVLVWTGLCIILVTVDHIMSGLE